MTAPCKDCPNRVVGCHSTCEQYIKYKEEQESVRRSRRAESEKHVYAIQSIMERKRKRRRR